MKTESKVMDKKKKTTTASQLDVKKTDCCNVIQVAICTTIGNILMVRRMHNSINFFVFV